MYVEEHLGVSTKYKDLWHVLLPTRMHSPWDEHLTE